MMSKSYVPNHSELCLRIHKWLDDIHSGYDVDLTDRDGTNHGYLVNNAIERLATLLGDELEAFENTTAEAFREDGYDAGWEDGLASERGAQLDNAASAHDEGYNEGWEQGYDQGYSEGYTSCQEDHDIRTDS